jgi:hypothetical protein
VRRVYHERLSKLARVTLVTSLKPLHAQIFDGPDAINRSESLDIYSTVHKLALIFGIVTLVAARLSLHSIKRERQADWLTSSLKLLGLMRPDPDKRFPGAIRFK